MFWFHRAELSREKLRVRLKERSCFRFPQRNSPKKDRAQESGLKSSSAKVFVWSLAGYLLTSQPTLSLSRTDTHSLTRSSNVDQAGLKFTV